MPNGGGSGGGGGSKFENGNNRDPIVPDEINGQALSETEKDVIDTMLKLEPQAATKALVSIKKHRDAMPGNLSKEEYDKALIGMSRKNQIALHYHDYPARLSAQEKQQLVRDSQGTLYLGVALRTALPGGREYTRREVSRVDQRAANRDRELAARSTPASRRSPVAPRETTRSTQTSSNRRDQLFQERNRYRNQITSGRLSGRALQRARDNFDRVTRQINAALEEG